MNPLDTVDVIIEYDDGDGKGIILITRKYPPYEGKLAVPGGFIEPEEQHDPKLAAVREMKEETGLDIEIVSGPWVFDAPGRDPRGPIVSGLYIAKGKGVLGAYDDAKTSAQYPRSALRNMLGKDLFAFDHEEMIRTYLEYRRGE